MRRFLILGLLMSLPVSLDAQASTAMTLSPEATTSGSVVLVEGGCGPYAFRAANGLCYRRPVYAPPPVVYRRCAWGWHPTPWGCRPNY